MQTPPSLPPRPLSPSPVRQPNPAPRRVSVLPNVLIVAVVLATLFTAWTPAGLFSGNLSEQFALILTAQPNNNSQIPANGTARPQVRIGIVSGHWGNESPPLFNKN
jgi:hypothetical protein